MTDQKKEKNRSIVYSFEGRWHRPIASGDVKVFFRKRRPVSTPERVYFYVGVPVKKIIGFAEIERIEQVKLEAATDVKKEGAITEEELVDYIGKNGTVSAIWVSAPTLLPEPFDLSELKRHWGFNPPQSFSNVSTEFERFLLGAMK
ncbi:hypothetical protein [Ruegeria atlantica]|uniref:hypothetical protein n=1 Tax=Ruegeria atlantica TaxID=81569 RepID=UPI001479FEEE|nr:hypothetical protein [Ruegeria atlantica]